MKIMTANTTVSSYIEGYRQQYRILAATTLNILIYLILIFLAWREPGWLSPETPIQDFAKNLAPQAFGILLVLFLVTALQMFPSPPFHLLIPFVQPHTKHRNHVQPVATVPCSAQHDEALSATLLAISSIVDCQDLGDVTEEKVNQIDLRGKMWDACKRGYRFCQEKAFQEGYTNWLPVALSPIELSTLANRVLPFSALASQGKLVSTLHGLKL